MQQDFNNAPPLRSFERIPPTTCTVRLDIRPGGTGEDGLLKRSKDGQSEALDCEFTILDGPYINRKIWQLVLMRGTSDGHAKASEISRAFLRGVLESARGIRPDDMSEGAQEKRRAGLRDLHGLRFTARILVEKSKDPQFDDKNKWQRQRKPSSLFASSRAAGRPACRSRS
jgi:hypothetical protein